MQSRIERNHLFAVLRALYLSSAAISMGWIFYNYASLSAVTVPMTVLFGLFAILTIAAAINVLRRDRFLRGSSLDVLSLGTQKFLRLVGLTIGIPPILYCLGFAAFVLTFDDSDRALNATTMMRNFELSVFHKTVVLDYINAWIQIRPIEPPPESLSYVPVDSCALISPDSDEPCSANNIETPSWSPLQAAGPPDSLTPTMDSTTAWASLTRDDQNEWLTLTYAHPIVPSTIEIFEALSPGAVSRVCAFDAAGKEIELWHGQDPLLARSKNGNRNHPWFWHWTLPVPTQFATSKLKLYLSSKDVPDWNEIDAVGMTAIDGTTHWAINADASSTYATANSSAYSSCAQYCMPYSDSNNYSNAWHPEQATGTPDTTGYGDITTAWASATRDEQDEWLEVEFAEPVKTREVLVHETYNPGALCRVELYAENGEAVAGWTGVDPTPTTENSGVSRIELKSDIAVTKAKLFLASKKVKGWNEIDAVGLRDNKGNIHYATSARASTTYGVANTQ